MHPFVCPDPHSAVGAEIGPAVRRRDREELRGRRCRSPCRCRTNTTIIETGPSAHHSPIGSFQRSSYLVSRQPGLAGLGSSRIVASWRCWACKPGPARPGGGIQPPDAGGHRACTGPAPYKASSANGTLTHRRPLGRPYWSWHTSGPINLRLAARPASDGWRPPARHRQRSAPDLPAQAPSWLRWWQVPLPPRSWLLIAA